MGVGRDVSGGESMSGVRTKTHSTKIHPYMGIVNRTDEGWSAFHATRDGFVETEHLTTVERYGADQWRRGNAGREPQEFGEWRREWAEDRRAAFNGGEI